MNMNPEVKKKWTDALRSGEYAQTNGYLCVVESSDESVPVGYCCLGVLSDLAVKNGVELKMGEFSRENGKTLRFDGFVSFPPEVVTEWAGLVASNPHVTYNGVKTTLADLNDDEGLDFAEIADIIDEQL